MDAPHKARPSEPAPQQQDAPKRKSVAISEGQRKKNSVPKSEVTTKKRSVAASEAPTRKSGTMSDVTSQNRVGPDEDDDTTDEKTSREVETGSDRDRKNVRDEKDQGIRRTTIDGKKASRSRIPVPLPAKKRTLEGENVGGRQSLSFSKATDPPGDDEMTSGETEEGETDVGEESVKNEMNERVEREREREAQERAAAERVSMLKHSWDMISIQIQHSFDSPSRLYKLRGYHSEPDLTIPFEDKFDIKMELNEGKGEDDTTKKQSLVKGMEKFLSLEDITDLSGKEHPDLVFGESPDLKLKASAVTDKLKCTWMELVEMEKGRYSFFDELFAMGYVTDSLEVPSPPPKGEEERSLGEYFVEAEEKHYRKKVDYGRVVFKTKHVYTGNFQDWFFEGPGRYCWEDGTIYQGDFQRGVMHGPGSIQWPDGCIYEGTFDNGARTGWGVYSTEDGQTYAGEWLNGLPQGHGKMWYDPEDAENNYYEGHWEKGLHQGNGTRQYATGDRYIGNWSQGMRNGYGIMIWLRERQVYKGDWLDGVPHGFGKHIWYLHRTSSNCFPTRHVYHGAWTTGVREGIGKMIYPCGSVYEGRWKNGQRHGKGMFINPAGGIVVGLFRAGAIVGGSDVPLHAPTYECDYGGLTDWLTAKFNLVIQNKKKDVHNLQSITKQYLPYLRKLYHRAGEYSQKYGNHGLYPAYMKKFSAKHRDSKSGKHALHRDYSRAAEPPHMRGKIEKPDSLDGVNPVTRFGLWLLVKDCEDVLDEVTMAYYDQIWVETPPLSFQTKHNPFEPVYLWQFLQCLIVVALAYYVDIPRRKRKESRESVEATEVPVVAKKSPQKSRADEEKQPKQSKKKNKGKKYSLDDVVNLSRTVHSSLRTLRPRRSLKNKKKKKDNTGSDETIHKGTFKEKFKAKASGVRSKYGMSINVGEAEQEADDEIATERASRKPTIDDTKKHSEEHVDGEDSPTSALAELEEKDGSSNLDTVEEDLEKLNRASFDSKTKDGINKEEKAKDEESPTGSGVPPEILISEYFEKFLMTKLLPCLKRNSGANLPVVPHPLPALVDMYDAFKCIKNRDILNGSEIVNSLLQLPDDAVWWHKKAKPPAINVELKPSSVDESEGAGEQEYETKSDIEEKGNEEDNEEKRHEDATGDGEEDEGHPLEDFLKPPSPGEEFNEIADDTVSEYLGSEPVGGDDNSFILDDTADKAESDEPRVVDVTFNEPTDNPGSEYLGVQAQESETVMKLLHLENRHESVGISEVPVDGKDKDATEDESSCEEDKPNQHILDMGRSLASARATVFGGLFKMNDSETSLNEYIVQGHPFAEDELAPEPFLWADDYKCIPAPKKPQHLNILSIDDLFSVMHEVYPNLHIGKKELNFDFIFCDWLWCMSLLAKISTEREFRDVWQVKGSRRALTNPQSYGVYSHYVKLIKNNPYLSGIPPEDFEPKPRQEKENSKLVNFTTAH